MDVELGEVWEMYSAGAGEWVRVVVTKIEDGEVTLRYESVLEFITVDGSDMQNPELFRRSELPKPSGVVLRLPPPP